MKTIHIPKVEGEYFCVKFYRSKSRRYTIYLQKQTIAGFVVPKDTMIDINWTSYYRHSRPSSEELEIPVYYVNRMLRFVYLEKLRNGTI